MITVMGNLEIKVPFPTPAMFDEHHREYGGADGKFKWSMISSGRVYDVKTSSDFVVGYVWYSDITDTDYTKVTIIDHDENYRKFITKNINDICLVPDISLVHTVTFFYLTTKDKTPLNWSNWDRHRKLYAFLEDE